MRFRSTRFPMCGFLSGACALSCGGGQGGAEGPAVGGEEVCTPDACTESAQRTAAGLSAARAPRRVYGGKCENVAVIVDKQVSGTACTCSVQFTSRSADPVFQDAGTAGNKDAAHLNGEHGERPLDTADVDNGDDAAQASDDSDDSADDDDGDEGASESTGTVTVGPVGLGCFVRDDFGACLYDDTEFSGCSASDDQCPAVCAELDRRYVAAAAVEHSVEVESASCNDESGCNYILEIDGRCYPNGSQEVGRSYDCGLGEATILEREAKAQTPSGQDEIQTGLDLTNKQGWVSLAVAQRYVGPHLEQESFSVSAQFLLKDRIDTKFGTIVDALDGPDDCGIFVSAGLGTGAQSNYLRAESVVLLDENQRLPLEEFGSGDFYSYGLDLTSKGQTPRYGQSYGLEASGGDLNGNVVLSQLHLPERLELPVLQQLAHHPRQPVLLEWTGESAEPIKLSVDIEPTFGTYGNAFHMECQPIDDGEFAVSSALLADAPDGIMTLTATRALARAEGSGSRAVLGLTEVSASHTFAFGDTCDNQAALDACLTYAEHLREVYAECGEPAPIDVKVTCPDFLATSCATCPEFFECMQATTTCPMTLFHACSCP